MSHRRSTVLTSLLLLLVTGWTVGCDRQKTAEIAAILPLTGPVESYGTTIKRGIELALELRQANGENPVEIQLSVFDSETEPAKAAELLEQAYEDGAVAAIGGVTSAEALEMIKVAEEKDKVLVSPSASSPDLTGMSKNFFRVFPSDFVEGTKMGNFAANTLKLGTVVIIAAESPYGEGIQGVFETEFERHGGEVVEVMEYPANTSDFSGLIDRLATLGPDGTYLAAFWYDIVALIKQIKEDGRFEGKIMTTAAFATPQAIAEAGDDAEGVYFTQTVFDLSSDDPNIRKFVDAFRNRYGEEPDIYAAHGYDAMRVMIEAAETGGTLPSEFWKGIRGIRSFPGVTGALQFDEKGDVQKYPRVYLIQDGAPVNYEEHVREIKEAFRQRLRELEEQQQRLRN